MVKVSVIIPVYNGKEYLKECLESIINQTLNDIEILCINDGSTDSSLDILNSYAKQDQRVKVFSQKNQGQGAARNKGLNLSKGEFIYFMDADDILRLDALTTLYNFSNKNNLDIAMFKLINYDDEKDEYFKTSKYELNSLNKFKNGKIFNHKDMGNLIFSASRSPVNKLYKRKLIGDIRFPKGVIFEDNIFYWQIIFSANRISIYPEYMYIRRRHSSSTTTLGDTKYMDIIKISDMAWEVFKKFGYFDKYRNKLYNSKVGDCYSWFFKTEEEYREEFFNEIKNHLIETSNNELYPNFKDVLTDKNKMMFNCFVNSQNYADFKSNYVRYENEYLLNENKKLRKDIRLLKKLNNQKEKKINQFLLSSSWKLTKPLRLFKKGLKKFKR